MLIHIQNGGLLFYIGMWVIPGLFQSLDPAKTLVLYTRHYPLPHDSVWGMQWVSIWVMLALFGYMGFSIQYPPILLFIYHSSTITPHKFFIWYSFIFRSISFHLIIILCGILYTHTFGRTPFPLYLLFIHWSQYCCLYIIRVPQFHTIFFFFIWYFSIFWFIFWSIPSYNFLVRNCIYTLFGRILFPPHPLFAHWSLEGAHILGT